MKTLGYLIFIAVLGYMCYQKGGSAFVGFQVILVPIILMAVGIIVILYLLKKWLS